MSRRNARVAASGEYSCLKVSVHHQSQGNVDNHSPISDLTKTKVPVPMQGGPSYQARGRSRGSGPISLCTAGFPADLSSSPCSFPDTPGVQAKVTPGAGVFAPEHGAAGLEPTRTRIHLTVPFLVHTIDLRPSTHLVE